MFCGDTPVSRSRATRLVSTRVLPEPALAESQVLAVGSAASIWRSVASSNIIRPPSSADADRGEVPFPEPRQMIVVARESELLGNPLRGVALRPVPIGADQICELRPGRGDCVRPDLDAVELGVGAEPDIGHFRHTRAADVGKGARLGHHRFEGELLVELLLLPLRRDRAGLVVVDVERAGRVPVDPVGAGGQGEIETVQKHFALRLGRHAARRATACRLRPRGSCRRCGRALRARAPGPRARARALPARHPPPPSACRAPAAGLPPPGPLSRTVPSPRAGSCPARARPARGSTGSSGLSPSTFSA